MEIDYAEYDSTVHDLSIPEMDREHIFYGFWHHYINNLDKISREALSDILKFVRWIYPVSDLIVQLCRHEKIYASDVDWLLSQLPIGSFSYNQVVAYKLIHDRKIDWETKYKQSLVLKANWAVTYVLRTVPREQLEQIREILLSANLSKNVLKWQLEILSNRAKSY